MSSPISSRIVHRDPRFERINMLLKQLQDVRELKLEIVSDFLQDPDVTPETVSLWRSAHPQQHNQPSQHDIETFYREFLQDAFVQLQKGHKDQYAPALVWRYVPKKLYNHASDIVRLYADITKLQVEKQEMEQRIKEEMRKSKNVSQQAAAVAMVRGNTVLHPVWSHIASKVKGGRRQ